MTQFSSLYTARLDEELGTDDSTTLFTTARRKSAVNRGLEQFAELTDCLVRWSTLVLTGGTGEYDLNSTAVIAATDYVRLTATPIEFFYTDASSNVTILSGQDDLPHRSIKWLDDNEPGWRLSTTASTTAQLPSLTYLRADGGSLYLGFWPTPSTGSSASMKALIPYLARPSPITSDTSEPYTLGGALRVDLRVWHQASVHFAAHQLEKLRRDEQASQAQLQMFLGYVSRYFQNTRGRQGHVISQARRYFTRGGSLRQTDRPEDPRT